jgi:hypothetical protein
MKKVASPLNRESPRRGFVLLEPVLAGALLAMFTLVMMTQIVASRNAAANVADRTQALFLAQEGLEVARNIRDNSFDNLTTGTWGLLFADSVWALDASPDTNGRFTRTLTIGDAAENVRSIESRVSWQTDMGERQVLLETRLTRWQ